MKQSDRRRPLIITSLLALCFATSAHADITVRSALADDHQAQPGTSYESVIVVGNDSDSPQRVRFYQTDYRFSAGGANSYDPPGSHGRSNASWITLSHRSIVLAPGEVVPVSFTVEVPSDIEVGALSGTYWSMIMVQGVAEDAPESPDWQEQQIGFRQVTRYGVQVSTTVGTAGERVIDFPQAQVIETDGVSMLEVDLENIGDFLARTRTWIEVFDSEGQSLGRRDANAFRLFPGTSARQRISLGDLASGAYEILVVVDAGNDDFFAAQYTVAL